MPSATLPPVTAATTSHPSYASAVKQFHSAKPGPVVFQTDDQSTAATTSQPSYTSAVKQFHSANPELAVFQIDYQSIPPLPSANISIASSSNNSGVSLNLVGGGCEDNAVLYTTRRDYLKPADVFVFAILDKPDIT